MLPIEYVVKHVVKSLSPQRLEYIYIASILQRQI